MQSDHYLDKMSHDSSPQFTTKGGHPEDTEKAALDEPADSIHGPSIGEGIDILGQQSIDPALNAKMHIVNNVSELPQAPSLLESCVGNARENLSTGKRPIASQSFK